MFVKTCLACRTRKSTPPLASSGKMQSIVVDHPFACVQMDVLGPFTKASQTGNQYVITFFDVFTRWPEAVCLPHAPTALDVADALLDVIITRHACPRTILTDRGSAFMSKVFKRLMERMNVVKLNTSAYAPNCNGRVEGLHYFLATAIYAFVDKKHVLWDRYLNCALFAYRIHPIAGLGFSPFELLYNRKPVLPVDILFGASELLKEDVQRYALGMTKDLRLAYDIVRKQQRIINKKRRERHDNELSQPRYDPKFQPSQEVLMKVQPALLGRTAKFLHKWAPATVIRTVARNVWRVRNDWTGRESTVHARRLLPRFRWSAEAHIQSPWSTKGPGFFNPQAISLRHGRLSSISSKRVRPRTTSLTHGQQTVVDTRSKRRRKVRPLMGSDGMIRGF